MWNNIDISEKLRFFFGRKTHAGLAIAAVLIALGCSQEKKQEVQCSETARKRILSVAIRGGVHQVDRPVRFEEEELRSRVEKVLSESKVFVFDPKNEKPCGAPQKVMVDLYFRQIMYQDKGQATISISIIMEPMKKDSEEKGRISRGEAQQVFQVSTTHDLKDFYLELLQKGFRDTFRFIEVEEKLSKARPAAVCTALEAGVVGSERESHRLRPGVWQQAASAVTRSAIPMLGAVGWAAANIASTQLPPPLDQEADDIQEIAIRIIATRKLGDCLPSLLHTIRFSGQERLREQAMEAIVQIGDRSVVPKLTEMTQFQDSEGIRSILEVVSQLGGAEARAFLILTADGHPDRDVRNMARSALKALSP